MNNVLPANVIPALRFDEWPDDSPVFIYASDRRFSDHEQLEISQSLTRFCDSWQAHGKSVSASFEIIFQRFIVVCTHGERQLPTGCAKDELRKCIEDIEQRINVNLSNRLLVHSYKNNELFQYDFNELRTKTVDLKDDEFIFDHSLITLGALKNKWLLPLKESWISRFLK